MFLWGLMDLSGFDDFVVSNGFYGFCCILLVSMGHCDSYGFKGVLLDVGVVMDFVVFYEFELLVMLSLWF